MEYVSGLLNSKLDTIVWLGRSKKKCQRIDIILSGGIYWSMERSILEPLPENGIFFDTFFGFQEWIESINNICEAFIKYHEDREKCEEIAELINAHYTWHKFVDVPRVEFPKDVQFRSKSFVLYLQQQLNIDNLPKNPQDAVRKFLYQNKLLDEPFEELTLEVLDERLKAFDILYRDVYAPKLREHYQSKLDILGIYEAIYFGTRTKVPYCAAYKFLLEKEKEKDPSYRARIMRDARLNAFK